MTLFTTDYLEYYLTLVSWIVHNGIWAVLVSSDVFALPFVAIIVQEWLKAPTKATRACSRQRASRTGCSSPSWW